MALRDWVPVPASWFEPDNGLTAAQERDYERNYDDTVKRLKAGSGGRRAAQSFIDSEHEKYKAWRAAAQRQSG